MASPPPPCPLAVRWWVCGCRREGIDRAPLVRAVLMLDRLNCPEGKSVCQLRTTARRWGPGLPGVVPAFP